MEAHSAVGSTSVRWALSRAELWGSSYDGDETASFSAVTAGNVGGPVLPVVRGGPGVGGASDPLVLQHGIQPTGRMGGLIIAHGNRTCRGRLVGSRRRLSSHHTRISGSVG